MEELKELKLGKDLVGNKDAQTLAHDLLGKIIHCADGDYLITVTEAYPADDYYSYIYRATHNEDGTKKSENEIDKNGKAYKILTDENMVGEFFLYGGMLHLACKANKAEARIELDTLDRAVGEHKLPENCIVIAAGNRTTDKSVAFKMPKALANRLLHIEVEVSFNSWKQWAIQSGINEKVVGFLTFNRERLMNFDSNADDLAFATPRSWEMVSNILNYVDSDVDKMYSLIAGVIGFGPAIEFRTWSKVYKDLPNIEEIFDGKQPKVPTRTDAMYALCASMTAYAREYRDDMKRIANSIIYAQQMAPDFSTVLLKDYMYIEKDYRKKLLNIPEFSAWLNSKGKLLNGNI